MNPDIARDLALRYVTHQRICRSAFGVVPSGET